VVIAAARANHLHLPNRAGGVFRTSANFSPAGGLPDRAADNAIFSSSGVPDGRLRHPIHEHRIRNRQTRRRTPAHHARREDGGGDRAPLARARIGTTRGKLVVTALIY
jgi:hypothetical protein